VNPTAVGPIQPVILIDTATDADASALLDIYRGVLSEGRWFITYPDEFNGTEETQARTIRDRNAETNGRLLAARVHDRLVGSLSIKGGAMERTRHVGMIEVYVDKSARRKGVGRALIEAGIVWAETNPILRKLALNVFEDNHRAVDLYRRLGFVVEGRLVGEFMEEDGTQRNDLMMARSV
jgi:ribosomal protein S18 acetylase RimI-like enzyme